MKIRLDIKTVLSGRMSNILGVHHVSLLVKDLNESLAFYQDVLGLALIERPELGFDGAWLALGTTQQLHLLVLDNPRQAEHLPEHGGRDQHFALAVLSIDPIVAKLNSANIQYTQSRSGRQAVFFRDPDGNAIECVQTPI